MAGTVVCPWRKRPNVVNEVGTCTARVSGWRFAMSNLKAGA